MTIRLATIADLPWLRQLHTAFVAEVSQRQAYPHMDDEGLDHWTVCVLHALKNDPTFFCFVAIEEVHFLGYLGGGILTRLVGTPSRVATVHWLYVDPVARRHGLSRQLLAAALAWSREHFPDVTHAELNASMGMTLWQSWGFQPYQVAYQGPLTLVDQFITGTKPPAERANGAGKKARRPAREEGLHG